MQISKKTQRQIDELERLIGLTFDGRAFVERIAAEAAHDASSRTAEVCRQIAADSLIEQRSRLYERIGRISTC